MKKPLFRDSAPIRSARNAAYNCINEMCENGIIGQSLPKRLLIVTLKEEYSIPATDDKDTSKNNPSSSTPLDDLLPSVYDEKAEEEYIQPRPYDPEAERDSELQLQRIRKERINNPRLHAILDALAELADDSKPKLSPLEIKRIRSVLDDAPAFIISQFLQEAQRDHVDTRQRQEEEKNNEIMQMLSEAPYDAPGESDIKLRHRHTPDILKYTAMRTRTLENALSHLVTTLFSIKSNLSSQQAL